MIRYRTIAVVAAITLGVTVTGAVYTQRPAPTGSTGGTTTIDANHIPPPPPPFSGTIQRNALESKPHRRPRVVPPKRAPNVLLITTSVGGSAPFQRKR
jgi:arylsulfatase